MEKKIIERELLRKIREEKNINWFIKEREKSPQK
jgi:hypothetical protein